MTLCQECETPIPAERLRLIPNAEFCVRCQESEERDGNFVRTKMAHKISFRNDDVDMEGYLVRAPNRRAENS